MMKFLKIVLPMGMVLLFVSSAMGQSRRLDDLADRLAEQTNQFAEQSYGDFTDRSRNTRTDVEALFQDEQVKSSAALFRRMVRDRRPRTQLQNASLVLSDMVRAADRYGRQRSLMNDIQRTVADIQRELNFGGGIGGGIGSEPVETSSGTMRWRGTVDDITQIHVQESNAEARAVSGTPNSDGTFNFSSPLPFRRTVVRLNKIRGRGEIRIIQQPSRSNDFTAVVEIRDPNRGPSDYEFELSW
jgi:hypothetical protein